MSAFSKHLSELYLDFMFQGATFTPPTDYYVGLFTENPTPLGTGDEVSGGGYTRVLVSFDIASDMSSASLGDVNFPVATGDWGEITHVGIFNASESGELYFFGALENPRSIYTGDEIRFDAGEIVVAIN